MEQLAACQVHTLEVAGSSPAPAMSRHGDEGHRNSALGSQVYWRHAETSIGAATAMLERISEDWFRSQFAGKTGPFVLVPEGTRSTSPEEMDAITGATVTSKAVRDMMNAVRTEAAGTSGREEGG